MNDNILIRDTLTGQIVSEEQASGLPPERVVREDLTRVRELASEVERLTGALHSLRVAFEGGEARLAEARAAIARVRSAHHPIDQVVIAGACADGTCDHEDECPTITVKVCAHCLGIGEAASCFPYEDAESLIPLYPCGTIRALDSGAASGLTGTRSGTGSSLSETAPEDERISAWHRIADHPAFRPCFASDEPLIDSMLARLDELAATPTIDPRYSGAASPLSEFRTLQDHIDALDLYAVLTAGANSSPGKTAEKLEGDR